MSEKEKKSSLEDLQKRVNEVRELAERSRDQIKRLTEKPKDQFKEAVEKRLLESSATIFFFGLVVGLILGIVFPRRK